MDKNEIPSVPTCNPELNSTAGFKNLAAWMARYKNFGLRIDEVSPFVKELLENGTLVQFEPTLKGLEAGYSGSADEYERYEFDVCIEDFVNINGHDWANLHFTFQVSKCIMFIECCNQSMDDKLSPVLEYVFNAIEVDPLLDEEDVRDLAWKEADDIVLRYLKYMNNPDILSVPE